MHKRNKHWTEWRKPRYNRSRPKLLRGKAARTAIAKTANQGLLAIDHCTRWKSPISQETFDELVARELLTPEQIEQYNKRLEEEENAKNLRKLKGAKAKKRKNFALITEIAKHDLTTIEGLEAFKEILEQNPKALNLIAEAQKFRASNE